MASIKKNNAKSVDVINKEIKDEKQHYDIAPIDKTGATVKLIVGKRKNGKSYQVLKKIVEDYAKTQHTSVYLRRWELETKPSACAGMYNTIVKNKIVEKATKGKWTDICFYRSAFYLCNYDEKGDRIKDRKPFLYVVALNAAEHFKSNFNDPYCFRIMFDEFLASHNYLPTEWTDFLSLYSTIKRDKPDNEFEVYMLGNTVNPLCPYFWNMGLVHLEDMEKGTIRVYNFPGKFKLALELTRETGPANSEELDGFFYAFDDPHIRMIRDGDWEFEQFPLYKDKDMGDSFDQVNKKNILFTYYVLNQGYTLKCHVVNDQKGIYCYVRKVEYTLRRDDYDTEVIYQSEPSIRPNIRDTFQQPRDKIDTEINRLYACNLFRYYDNWTACIMRDYLEQF